jgi:hypothetical protein
MRLGGDGVEQLQQRARMRGRFGGRWPRHG